MNYAKKFRISSGFYHMQHIFFQTQSIGQTLLLPLQISLNLNRIYLTILQLLLSRSSLHHNCFPLIFPHLPPTENAQQISKQTPYLSLNANTQLSVQQNSTQSDILHKHTPNSSRRIVASIFYPCVIVLSDLKYRTALSDLK